LQAAALHPGQLSRQRRHSDCCRVAANAAPGELWKAACSQQQQQQQQQEEKEFVMGMYTAYRVLQVLSILAPM
jgi:hypothetical protein